MSQTVPPTLDPLPEAPSTNKPTVFAQVMDAFLVALIVFRTQLVALGQNIYANAQDAYASALNAAASAMAALNSATSAAASALQADVAAKSAGLVVGALPFVPNQVYAQGAAAISNSNQQTYRRIALGSAATDPAADPVNWTRVLATPDVARFTFSASDMLVRQHQLGLVDLTGAGGFTLTFDTAVNLKAGWACWVRNLSTGDITVQRSGGDSIDGRTSYKMYPGEVRFFHGDGASDIRSFVQNGFVKEFRSSANFEKPPGYLGFEVDLVSAGAGGAGGAAGATAGGGGGGAGGRRRFFVLASAIAIIVPVVIGLGGVGGAAGASGTAGGNSQFGSYPLIYGGAPGAFYTTGSQYTGGGGGGPKWAPISGGTSSSNGLGAGMRLGSVDASFENGGNSSSSTPLYADWGGGAGGGTKDTTPFAFSGGSSLRGPAGGGSGSAVANAAGVRGGASGATLAPDAVSAAVGDGPNGVDAATLDDCGTGGTGGNGGSGNPGRKGGDGGYPGGGGGGGGSGTTGGVGGKGRDGRCVIKGVI